MRVLPKASISTLKSGPNPKPESSSAGCPILFLQQNRAQPLTLSGKLPKAILNPRTPQNTPVDMAQPSRKTRPNSIHQNTGTRNTNGYKHLNVNKMDSIEEMDKFLGI